MKYIGLDLGNRTCGVAISDSLGMIATRVETIRYFEKDLDECLEKVVNMINEKHAEKIVMGYPLNMNGTVGPQAEFVIEFKKCLKKQLA